MAVGDRYPGYDVLAKWRTPSFDDATRRVLAERLARVPERRFLSEEEWRLLEAVVARLIPQPDRAEPIPIVPWIDAMLAEGRGEGYRRDGIPPMREQWRRGLAALADEAGGFESLAPAEQDALLGRVQRGEVGSDRWRGLPPDRFFADLLRAVAGIYYSHPQAWNEIGFGGPASPRGYVRLGFDERDAWEAREADER